MSKFTVLTTLVLSIFLSSQTIQAKQWSLKECIEYALNNNIQLNKTLVQNRLAIEDTQLSKAALFPSLQASTSQNVTYRPWPQSDITSQGFALASVDKVYYNGTYSLTGNWTVWNGQRNTNQVKQNQLTEKQTALDSAVIANQLIEQISQLYVQILYTKEAIKVNQATLEVSLKNEERGKEFVTVQKMSKADMLQLSAQRAQDEYNVVEAENNLREYQRQLKQLLQITNDTAFDVILPNATDEMAQQLIPSVNDVYQQALNTRAEIKNAQLGIENSDLSIKIAKAGKLPTVSLNAGVGTSTTSMSNSKWEQQLKNNFDIGAGISVSVPLFDNRQTKTAVNKAILQKQNYMLDLKEQQTKLYAAIENYWLQATNNQHRWRAAKVSTMSAEESFKLINAKFEEKLINVVELMNGKNQLITAQQNELQAKYLTILNLQLLKFYQQGEQVFF